MLEPELNKNEPISSEQDNTNQHQTVPIKGAQDVLKSLENTINQAVNFEAVFNQSPVAIGENIADKYKVIDIISSGSMGLVYKAKDLALDRIVAIKVARPDQPLQLVHKKRFEREACIVASLKHPNIVTLYDSGVLKNGMLYLVMEYLEGQTLTDFLKVKEQLEFHEAGTIFIQICSALKHAHSHNVIHRDLKPSNIILVHDDEGRELVKVIDFSIAKFTKPKPDQKTITRPGDMLGSPLYMSPEQCKADQEIDHRSDIYSFGCVMYELLCGEPPLEGNDAMATIYMHVNTLPSPISEHTTELPVPNNLDAIIVKTLQKKPENRYQTAEELLAELEFFYEQEKKKSAQFGWFKQLSGIFNKQQVGTKR